MQYKDYYAILGLERNASADDIKKAYRRLARKYHPDVSKEAGAEDRFKEIAEAYQALRDPERRAAYDDLGRHKPGEEFRPPPDWEQRFGGESFAFDDLDLSDLFAGFARGARAGRGAMPMPGQDFDVDAAISLEEAFHGTTLELDLSLPEYDEQGRLRRVPRTIKARIPSGAIDGQRLRLRGKGGHGIHGGRDGDLYLNIRLRPHALFRVNGHDLYLDLPIAPWEAAFGATIDVPTLGGTVRLKVPPHSQAEQRLRLAGRGLPRPRNEGPGDLYAVLQIVMPAELSEREAALLRELGQVSSFDPRAHLVREVTP